MKLSQKDHEFFNDMEFGLKEGLKMANDWHDADKVNFIRGQLKMLRMIRDMDEDKNRPDIIIPYKL